MSEQQTNPSERNGLAGLVATTADKLAAEDWPGDVETGRAITGYLPPAELPRLAGAVDYAADSVVSKTVLEDDDRTVTLFAFDEGQALSEHSAPFHAFVHVLDGEAELVIGGQPVRATPEGFVLMPADVPHAVRAVERFKMLLVMLHKGEP